MRVFCSSDPIVRSCVLTGYLGDLLAPIISHLCQRCWFLIRLSPLFCSVVILSAAPIFGLSFIYALTLTVTMALYELI